MHADACADDQPRVLVQAAQSQATHSKVHKGASAVGCSPVLVFSMFGMPGVLCILVFWLLPACHPV